MNKSVVRNSEVLYSNFQVVGNLATGVAACPFI
jgi:hypothetical protein